MKSPGKKTILLLLAALVALTIAGCGGGGGDETTDTTAATTTEEPEKLSKAELIEQGDGICAETNAAVGALSSEIEASSLPETAEKTSNLYIGMVERLQELGAPEGAESGFTSFMEAAEEFAKVEGEIKLAIEREDSEALSEASNEATPALEEFETQAEAYGFKECSEGPQASLSGPGSSSAEEPEGGEVPEGLEEEGGVESEPEYVEPEYEEEAPPVEEAAPETGGAGGGAEAAPETGGGESGGGSESGGVGPG